MPLEDLLRLFEVPVLCTGGDNHGLGSLQQ